MAAAPCPAKETMRDVLVNWGRAASVIPTVQVSSLKRKGAPTPATLFMYLESIAAGSAWRLGQWCC